MVFCLYMMFVVVFSIWICYIKCSDVGYWDILKVKSWVNILKNGCFVKILIEYRN